MARAVDGELQGAIDALQTAVNADPDIQAVLQREKAQLSATHDKGGSARDYQKRVRDEITAIAKAKGYIPEGGQYFVNPNDGQLEPHGGWSGLSNKTRAAIIVAAGVATWGATGFAGAGALVPGGGGAGSATVTGAGAGAGGTAGTVATAGATAGGAGGVWGRLAGAAIPIAGRMLGAGAQGMTDNRVGQFSAAGEQERLRQGREGLRQQAERDYQSSLIDRETEGRTGRNDAWKGLQQASYVQNWAPSKQKFSPYTRDLVGPSDAVKEGAGGISAETMKRLTEGNPIAPITRPTPIPGLEDPLVGLQDPSIWERLMGYGGAGLDLWGALRPPVSTKR